MHRRGTGPPQWSGPSSRRGPQDGHRAIRDPGRVRSTRRRAAGCGVMDIALVVHYYDRSEGTGGYAVELATRFAAEHQVTVYAAGVRTPVPDGVRVVHVPAL